MTEAQAQWATQTISPSPPAKFISQAESPKQVGDTPRSSEQDLAQKQLLGSEQGSLAFHPDMHPNPHHLTNDELAAVHQQHQQLIMQAQQVQAQHQHQYEEDLRDKSGAMGMASADQLALAALQQHAANQEHLHLPTLHDADFDRDRKEKRKVANREAARRMRQRRADQMTTLDASNSELKAENNALQQQLSHLANHNRELMNENAMLKQDLLNMKQAMEADRMPIAIDGVKDAQHIFEPHQQA